MKRISFFLAAALLGVPAVLRAQDPAVEERLNKISAQIQDLVDAKESQNKRIEELARQLRELQEQQGKPSPNYASQEELKQLAGKLQEVDRKRQEDSELIVAKLKGLDRNLSTSTRPSITPKPVAPPGDGGTPVTSDKGYEYVVQAGDTLSVIVKAYAEKNIRVTVDQILKANPGLKPEKLRVGQKLFIPAPLP